MFKPLKSVSIAVAFIALPLSAYAQANGPAYPNILTTFDVRGIRIGMTPPQVVAILHELHGRSILPTKKLCEAQRVRVIAKGLNPDNDPTTPQCMSSITATFPGQEQMTVSFTEDLGTKIVKATTISYAVTGLHTAEDRQNFFDAVKKKFGPPTSAGMSEQFQGSAGWVQYECGLRVLPFAGQVDPCSPLLVQPYGSMSLGLGLVTGLTGSGLLLTDGLAILQHDADQRKLEQSISTGHSPKV